MCERVNVLQWMAECIVYSCWSYVYIDGDHRTNIERYANTRYEWMNAGQPNALSWSECYATGVYMLSVDEYGNGEETTICIRSKAIQIYFWVAFLRICHFYQSLFVSGLRLTGTRSTLSCCTTHRVALAWYELFLLLLVQVADAISRGSAYLLSNIRQRDRQIQNLLRNFFLLHVTWEFEFFYGLKKKQHERNKFCVDGLWWSAYVRCAEGNRMKSS